MVKFLLKHAGLCLALILAPPGAALAHPSERAYILLLPTELYMVGGALVVALSFAVMALIPDLQTIGATRRRLGRVLRWRTEGWSLISLMIVIALIIAGYSGSRDPLANPLPLTVWTLWWVGLTLLHAVFGNLWHGLNPWRGIYRLITKVPRFNHWRDRPPLFYPSWLGHWPAVVLFAAFAWFELIHPSPWDPEVVANGAALYVAATLAAMLAFGDKIWLRNGEAFSVFFRMVGWLSPLVTAPSTSRGAGPGLMTLWTQPPGFGLLKVGEMSRSGLAFVLLVLASVAFDGLSRTFWWLGLVGVNPLEHPGRTAMINTNSLGLIAMFGILAGTYYSAVGLGRLCASQDSSREGDAGLYVAAIIPIAFGYHAAHYLPGFLIDGQYAIRALSDPYGLGWNLFGTADLKVITSLYADTIVVTFMWNLQVAIIVAAHVLAVTIAHFLALRQTGNLRQALLLQSPMTVLMVAYTLFGLWLLSTPAS